MAILKGNEQYEKEFYMAGLGVTSGQTSDLEISYLQSETSSSSPNTAKLWREYLTANGFTNDNLTRAWIDFLVSQGYSGNATDMQNTYFVYGAASTSTTPIPTPSTLLNDILLYYKLDTDGSVSDSVGTKDGTIANATYTASGKINGAYSFNGSSSYIEVPEIGTEVGSTFSVSIWVKLNAVSGTQHIFGYREAAGTLEQLILVVDSSGKVIFYLKDNSSTDLLLTGTTTLVSDTWYHITGTLDSSRNATLYINGVSEDTGTIGSFEFASTMVGRIGARPDDTNYLNGYVDEVGIWTRDLTSSEITELYNSTNGNQYPF